MKRDIVVGIDFSACSVNALWHAVSIAQKTEAFIKLVWVKRPDFTKEVIYKYQNIEEEIEALFAELEDQIAEKIARDRISHTIREGKVYQEIVNYSQEENAFMIIIGTHGASGFEEFWMGSNAYKVVSAASCPVLTIRESCQLDKPLQKIVVPIDSTLSTRQKVPYAVQFARYFKAEIHILALYYTSVKAVQEDVITYSKQVAEYLEDQKVDFVLKSIDTKNVTSSTLDYAHEVDANMIVIMTEQITTTSNLWLGPYAQQMVHRSDIPVLSIHPKEYSRTFSR